MRLKILLVGLFVFLSMSHVTSASPLDFSWSAPVTYIHNKGTGGEVRYIIWFYTLGNKSEKPIVVPIKIFLVADTGEGYPDVYYPEIMKHVAGLDDDYREDKKYQYAFIAKGEMAPKAHKYCVAMFEDVDTKAKRLDIFVTGISHFFLWRGRQADYSYKITYEKEQDKWKLIEHGISKDTSYRIYDFEDFE
ncbi:MAG: hypothetical protein ACUBOA_04235 [Candidatus Loosdrechtia sp.]|uniref:hypothetical protein n=1 Tax=Candidatus Loosdrechtia sp. TaxID=3101272 RepID=UPI003A65206A|nr:MAG: hypothetical protein QY305_07455 [Candidatus Jettenia sp. AMX2]